jgi:hypothetical protein
VSKNINTRYAQAADTFCAKQKVSKKFAELVVSVCNCQRLKFAFVAKSTGVLYSTNPPSEAALFAGPVAPSPKGSAYSGGRSKAGLFLSTGVELIKIVM